MAGAKPVAHLAVLIPPPRLHRHRYHGVLAPNSPLRGAATAYGRGGTGRTAAWIRYLGAEARRPYVLGKSEVGS